MAKEAWGRWGAEDEAGAANLIGTAEVRHAAGLVRLGRVISLAQPISVRTPVPAHRPGVSHFMGRDGGDYAAGARRPGGFQFAEDTVVLPLHLGTHMDALCHAWCDDCLYNGWPGNTVRSTTGALRCGVEKMPPVVTRGVLLDIVRGRGRPAAPGDTIGVDELRRAAAHTPLRPGDAVLIRTGWLESLPDERPVDFDREPGIDVDGALWLAESGVSMVGADNFAIEAMPFPPGTVFPVHQRLIRDYGVPLLEGLALRELGEALTEAAGFLFAATPLPIAGATGSPVAPVAVL